jgi:AcrR family transcriptional regulator
MRGVADLLTSGAKDFTFRALAGASGVPERTLYRHYASKDLLLEAFWAWLNREQLAIPPAANSLDGLIEQAAAAYAAFDGREQLVRAMLHDPLGREARIAQAQARRAELRKALKDELVDVAPDDQKRLLVAVQLFMSAAGWETMKDYWGLNAAEMTATTTWAVQSLVAGAQRDAHKPRSRSAAPAKRKSG